MTIDAIELQAAISRAIANSVHTLGKAEHAVGLSSIAASDAKSVADTSAVVVASAANMTQLATIAMTRSIGSKNDADLEYTTMIAMKT